MWENVYTVKQKIPVKKEIILKINSDKMWISGHFFDWNVYSNMLKYLINKSVWFILAKILIIKLNQ